MVKAACPRLVIAGTASGVGKTSVTLGLVRALARQGLRVQTFKVGPDFLDPTYLARASGRTCYNLDGWMTSRQYVGQLFARATADADLAIVEGVMGMFDGASSCGLEGSTAEMALWLHAPVVLVVDAHGAARSLAASVKGFAQFEPGVRVAGVVANRSGSGEHRKWLAEALAAASLPPLVGAVPRGAFPPLESRHLGLVTADRESLTDQSLEQLADACAEHVDLTRLLNLARSSGAVDVEEAVEMRRRTSSRQRRHSHAERSEGSALNSEEILRCAQDDRLERSTDHGLPDTSDRGGGPVRVGIARDEAFHFYYPDNLEILQRYGAELVPFSPLADAALPGDLDALYLGGGYPEVHAAQLAHNAGMLEGVRRFAAERPVYAECGGLIYLARSVTALDGSRHALAGVLPIDVAMLRALKALGYAEVALLADGLLGPAGSVCRGHEFHYSEITADDTGKHGWQHAYSVRCRDRRHEEGFVKGHVGPPAATPGMTRCVGQEFLAPCHSERSEESAPLRGQPRSFAALRMTFLARRRCQNTLPHTDNFHFLCWLWIPGRMTSVVSRRSARKRRHVDGSRSRSSIMLVLTM